MRRPPLTRRRSFLFAAGILLGVALAAGWLVWHRRPPVATGPLSVSLWYWRQPFRIAPADAPILREMGVTTLFVRAGTMTRDAETGALQMVMPQVWAAPPPTGIGVHIVFNADYGLIHHLDRISDAALRGAFATAIREEWQRAGAANVPVVGVQLDFDCPTRLLPRYAALLAGLREDLRAMGAGKLALSITALPTWLTSREMDRVAAKVDFFAPQFYESVIPRTFDAATSNAGFATIGDEARLKRGLERAGRQSTPFWAGLPAYGHALVYDGKGQLRGAFHDASVLDMLRQPYYRLARAYPASAEGDHPPATDLAHFGGEEIVDLEPTGVGAPDRTNFHLVYDLPSATLVARQVASVRANRPANCRGIILFRYPEADATLSVPLASLRVAVPSAIAPFPRLKVLISRRPIAPWRKIEGDLSPKGSSSPNPDGATQNLFVTATNVGDGAAGVSPDAVTVDLRFDRTCLCGTTLAPGAFDAAIPFIGAPGNHCSVARALGIRLTALHLAPGESRTAGPFPISDSGVAISGEWRTRSEGDFTTVQGSFDLTRPSTGKHP